MGARALWTQCSVLLRLFRFIGLILQFLHCHAFMQGSSMTVFVTWGRGVDGMSDYAHNSESDLEEISQMRPYTGTVRVCQYCYFAVEEQNDYRFFRHFGS